MPRFLVQPDFYNIDRIGQPLKVLPSAANFVFAIPNRPAYDVLQHLQQHRVLVRHFNSPGVANGLRISVGTWEQCQNLLLALDS